VGINLLFDALTERLQQQIVDYSLSIPPEFQGRLRSVFFQTRSIVSEEYDSQGNLLINVRMQQADWSRLEKKEYAVLRGFIVT
jgi:GTP-binding protein HflX